MQRRILAIEDEEHWLADYSSWLPEELADVQGATTPEQARDCLRRRYYDVVLLDLSMDPNDIANRDNEGIQRYLSTRPDGTLYIVISAHINKREVRDAAFRMNAFGVIFKSEVDPDVLVDEVQRAFDAIGDPRRRFIEAAVAQLVGGPPLETSIITALQPGGATGLFQLYTAVFGELVPVVAHQHRPRLTILDNVVVGLIWSRKLGHAVSVTLANSSVSPESAAQGLSDWLGYPKETPPLVQTTFRNTGIQIFHEPNISPEHFLLPVISLDAGG